MATAKQPLLPASCHRGPERRWPRLSLLVRPCYPERMRVLSPASRTDPGARRTSMALGLLVTAGCVTSVPPGAPMSSTCSELPTVEECRAGADVITDERLWDCVRQQCTRIKIECGEEVHAICKCPGVKTGGGPAQLELRDVRYDGESLSGLVLIGAKEGSVCLDKSRLSTTHLDVDWVWDCTSGISTPVPSIVVDYYATPRRKEDLVILEPGYWFGGPIHISLFQRERPGSKPNPACVEVSLSLLPLEGGPAGRVRTRAWRDPPVIPEGGIPPEPEPGLDNANPDGVDGRE
jgi:hypothetical protein